MSFGVRDDCMMGDLRGQAPRLEMYFMVEGFQQSCGPFPMSERGSSFAKWMLSNSQHWLSVRQAVVLRPSVGGGACSVRKKGRHLVNVGLNKMWRI